MLVSSNLGYKYSVYWQTLISQNIPGLYYWINNYSYDWVEIYDGGNSSSTLIGRKLCGHKLPPPILSSTNEILIKFKSDNTVERTGYKIRAEAVGKTKSKEGICSLKF